MNKQIIAEANEQLGPESVYDYWHIGYKVFSYYDGIYSLLIDYNYDGWTGVFLTYTFTADGQVLNSIQLLRLAGLSEQDFYGKVKEATIKQLEGREVNGEEAVIGGEANPAYEFADLV